MYTLPLSVFQSYCLFGQFGAHAVPAWRYASRYTPAAEIEVEDVSVTRSRACMSSSAAQSSSLSETDGTTVRAEARARDHLGSAGAVPIEYDRQPGRSCAPSKSGIPFWGLLVVDRNCCCGLAPPYWLTGMYKAA